MRTNLIVYCVMKLLIKIIIFLKSHIDNFDKNITIKTRTSIKKKFIDIIFDFHIIDKDVFYKDLYFKDKVKSLILKHRKKDKEYKITVYINIINL